MATSNWIWHSQGTYWTDGDKRITLIPSSALFVPSLDGVTIPGNYTTFEAAEAAFG
jgi:hypothetical protein